LIVKFSNILFLISHLNIDFLVTLVENTRKLNWASYTKIFVRKDVYISRNCRLTNKIVKNQPKFVRKPEITAEKLNFPKFDYLKWIYTVVGAYYCFQSYI
jgi:hypothetical protein